MSRHLRTLALVAASAVLGVLESAAALSAQPPVRVLDAGTEPRQPLRPQYTRTQSERVTIEGRSLQEVSRNDSPGLESLESTERYTLALHTDAIEADGSARVRFEVIAASLHTSDPRRSAQESGQVASQLVGTTGWWRLDARGAVIEAAATARPGVPERISGSVAKNMARMLRERDMPVPEQAVGVGARWVQVLDTALTPKHTVTYELRALQGDVAHIDVSIAGSAEPDNVILEHRITGKGSIIFDARRLLPATLLEWDMATRTRPGVITPVGPRISTGRMRSSWSVVPLD